MSGGQAQPPVEVTNLQMNWHTACCALEISMAVELQGGRTRSFHEITLAEFSANEHPLPSTFASYWPWRVGSVGVLWQLYYRVMG